jgi:hypothetical protein
MAAKIGFFNHLGLQFYKIFPKVLLGMKKKFIFVASQHSSAQPKAIHQGYLRLLFHLASCSFYQ